MKQAMDFDEMMKNGEKVDLYDLRDYPVFRSILIHNGYKAFYDFSELLQKKSISNQEIDNSPVILALDEMFNDPKKTFHNTLSCGTELYRCREIISSEQIEKGNIQAQFAEDLTYHTVGYDEANSKEPPLLKPAAARANIAGVSYLYLAEDPYTACSEIRPYNHCYVSLATFHLLKDTNLIDLKENQRVEAFENFERKHELSIAQLITSIMQQFGMPAVDDSVYRVTQFVADYIRKAGYDGIRYQSAMSAGTNITLFNCHRSRVEYVSSKVILVHSHHLNLVDLDSGQTIPSPRDDSWNEEYLEDARRELENMVAHAKIRK